MRFFRSVPVLTLFIAVFAALATGCGYLPSAMEPETKAEKSKPDETDQSVKVHTVSCKTRAKGYNLASFDDLFVFSGDAREPFHPATGLPSKYDVRAYVWGFDNCMERGVCTQGDHYWLIKRGPEDDFSTWVVTPQFPRITIKSSCKNTFKVGERYRFSFSKGKLVGVSKN
ncbi:hypothetical protein [Microbulbifer aggregans]|uniref:hypothetical protein n=1 Tax=Microbulbifer aggregans TaxID=1769779 RepID=UPI001CFD2973|nr:hypothetical protein [Microbulbifer aggregans]